MAARTSRRPSTNKPKSRTGRTSRPKKPTGAATSLRAKKLEERGLVAPPVSVVQAKPKRRFNGNSRTDPGPGRRMRAVVLAGIAVLVLAASLMATSAIAQGGGNSGSIKVHDGTTADPPQRNEPHVAGDAFVEGFNMAADEGTLQFFSWPPTGNQELVLSTTWSADDGTPEFHFLAGPFELPCGHYRAEAQNGMEEDDFPGGTKSKMFWVECPPAEEPCGGDDNPCPCGTEGGEPCPCGTPGGEPCPIPCGEPGGEPCPCGTPGGEPCPPCGEPGQEPCPVPCGEPGGEPCPCGTEGGQPCPCGTEGGEPCPCGTPGGETCPIPCGEEGGEPCPVEEIACPADLSAVANGDESITLTWTPVAGSDGTNIYRAEGDDDLEYVTTVGADVGTYHDTDTVTGRGYAYSVTTLVGNEESEDCPLVEVTAIPEFPTLVGLGLASTGGLLALVVARRRKA